MEFNPMDLFEVNSIHLNQAGYEFALVHLKDEAVGSYPSCFMPMWVKWESSTDDHVVVILGSEPRLGIGKEVRVPRDMIIHLVSVKGLPIDPKKREKKEEEEP